MENSQVISSNHTGNGNGGDLNGIRTSGLTAQNVAALTANGRISNGHGPKPEYSNGHLHRAQHVQPRADSPATNNAPPALPPRSHHLEPPQVGRRISNCQPPTPSSSPYPNPPPPSYSQSMQLRQSPTLSNTSSDNRMSNYPNIEFRRSPAPVNMGAPSNNPHLIHAYQMQNGGTPMGTPIPTSPSPSASSMMSTSSRNSSTLQWRQASDFLIQNKNLIFVFHHN